MKKDPATLDDPAVTAEAEKKPSLFDQFSKKIDDEVLEELTDLSKVPDGEEDVPVAEMPGAISALTGKPKISKTEKNVLVRMVKKGSLKPTEIKDIAVCKLLVAYGYAQESIEDGDSRGVARRSSGKLKYTATPDGVAAAKMVKFSLRFGKR